MKKSITDLPTATPASTDTDLKKEIASMSDEEVFAMNAYNPIMRAATSGQVLNKNMTGADLDIFASVATLVNQINDVKSGDLSCAEATLAAQANTLDLIFNILVCKAAKSQLMSHSEIHMRLALKAQSQCRATCETLATIKNPKPMAFIKQQNIGLNQQINNDITPPTHANSVNSSNEVLENQHGEWVDSGATSTTIGTNQELETLGVIDGGQDARGKSAIKPECIQAWNESIDQGITGSAA